MTEAEIYILRKLAYAESTPYMVSMMARHDGLNRAGIYREWAHSRLRKLRAKGLVEYTGERGRYMERYQRITDAGRAALRAHSDGESDGS